MQEGVASEAPGQELMSRHYVFRYQGAWYAATDYKPPAVLSNNGKSYSGDTVLRATDGSTEKPTDHGPVPTDSGMVWQSSSNGRGWSDEPDIKVRLIGFQNALDARI